MVSEIRATRLDLLARAKFVEAGEAVKDTRAFIGEALASSRQEPERLSPEEGWSRIVAARQEAMKESARADQARLDIDFG